MDTNNNNISEYHKFRDTDHSREDSKRWYKNGKLHRIDGPAIEYAHGCKKWYQNGQLHRVNGPAIEYPNGYKEWYQYGQLHRDDGPAVEYINRDKEWWVNGKLNRVDDLTCKSINRHKDWYQNRHVIIRADGNKAWYKNEEFCNVNGSRILWNVVSSEN